MATRNFVPRADGEGGIGTAAKKWLNAFIGAVTTTTINKVTITEPSTNATLTIADTGSMITSGAYGVTLTATATTNATLPAGTKTLLANGDAISMADAVMSRPKLIDVSETVNALGDLAGGTDDIDLELGNVVTATVSTGAQTFTFSNPPATGSNGSFTLFLTNGGSQTVTYPTSVDWVGAEAPELTAAGVDVLVFTTNTAGTLWSGFVAGLDVK